MQLKFLGSTSDNGGSPTLYETDRGTFVVQGWKIADSETLSQMSIPGHETVVEIPRELLRFAPPATS